MKDLIDYHIHTALCGHAAGEMADYAAAAARKGLREIGFADHFPLRLLGFDPPAKVTMEAEELDCYVEAVRRLARSQQQLVVKRASRWTTCPGRKRCCGIFFPAILLTTLLAPFTLLTAGILPTRRKRRGIKRGTWEPFTAATLIWWRRLAGAAFLILSVTLM